MSGSRDDLRGGRGPDRGDRDHPPGESKLPGRVRRALHLRRDAGAPVTEDVDTEIRFHLESRIEELMSEGHHRPEAERLAFTEFGDVAAAKRALGRASARRERATRRAEWLGALGRDVVFGWRKLRGSPSFTAVAVLTLGLGIGATTAVFSVVDGLLLEPLGYGSPDRIVRLLEYRQDDDGRGYGTISQANYFDWMDEAEALEIGALYDEYRPTLRLDDGALKVTGASVGERYFDVLGLSPLVGRFFLPEEAEGGSSRVVLGEGLWREAFGADPGVIGRVIDLNGFPYTVVGVAPSFEDPGLSGHGAGEAPRLWRSPPSYFYTNGRGGRSFTALARLAPGATVESAQAELSSIHARLVEEYPEANADRIVRVVPLKADLVGDTAPVLWILLGAVGLVLLIACANVANLLLFRAAGRGREIALRSALGASRGQIVRQLLVESLLLGLAGATLGIAVAFAAIRAIVALAAGQLPRLDGVALDPGVLAFALAAGFLATIVSGLVPALHTARPDAAEALKEGGRGSAGSGSRRQGRLRTAVVAAQVALAVVVMLGAGLLGRSLLRLQAEDPGLAADGALVLRIDPPFDPYGPSDDDGAGAMLALHDRLRERLLRVPGVEAVGITDLLPMSGSFNGNSFRVVGRPEPEAGRAPNAETRAIDPHYLPTLGVPIVRGRGLAATDGLEGGPRAVVVNQAFAREHFPDDDAIGQQLVLFDPDAEPADIVGVAGDVTQFSLDEAPVPTVYIPLPQAPSWMQDEPWLVLRTSGTSGFGSRASDRASSASSLIPTIRAAVHSVDPRIPVYDAAAMDDIVSRTLARARFRTVLLLAFAALAFVLAIIGVYGMVAYTVARRLPELGVRLALGATAGRLRRLVVGQGLRPVAVGAAIGLAGGVAAVRLLASFVYGIPVLDPVTFVAAPVALAGVAALAAWLPARRAARVSPARVLREE